ncbi:alpha/beta-hydrolase [Xylaria bambusicola]|uniref:alpha/beta-hydrolase n=1 Tax=Xylaria bambusicola TaxID=326684 RepID=UPI002008651D|nr:alpha/beta-hydrolase [Xylaria bambusicola]KAI0505911.1 alpha/beta-hydrolase [Xylaria bambusicola]
MRNHAWLYAALNGLAICSTIAADPIVTLSRDQVTYRGKLRGLVEDFYNIKFAHDTSGAQRFAPPKAYSPAPGSEIDATIPGPACPQIGAGIPPFFPETPNQSEDCLNLRITRPSGITADLLDKLPVVVHLVGGGVVKGSAYDEPFDPANLVAQSVALSKPIIHVVLNYRLTIFGFARLPVLNEQKSLNVGMRDQRAGFQWVKDNIAAFGGDPDRITSFGLSSGGTFSSLHLSTYGGEHGVPFTQAWVMSGPPGTALNMTSDATENHTYAVAERLGCNNKDDDRAVLDCLRQVPMDQLTEAAMAYSIDNHPPAGLFTFIPSVDDDFLPERQSTLYKSGRFVKGIPMVFGWVQDDGATNAGPAPLFQSEEDMKTPIRNFAHALTDDDYAKLFSLYPAKSFQEDVHNYEARKAEDDPDASVHYFRIARIMRDLLFTCSSIDFGFEIARQSQDPNGFSSVYHYVLNQSMVTPLFHAAGMPYLGAVHGSDLDYLYNNMFPRDQMSDSDKHVSDTLISSFVNFAYTGSPNSESLPSWPHSFSTSDNLDELESKIDSPSSFNLRVIGGPLGGGAVRMLRGSSNLSSGEQEGIAQIPLGNDVQYGEMKSRIYQDRQREVDREDLLLRCAFINGLAEKLGH